MCAPCARVLCPGAACVNRPLFGCRWWRRGGEGRARPQTLSPPPSTRRHPPSRQRECCQRVLTRPPPARAAPPRVPSVVRRHGPTFLGRRRLGRARLERGQAPRAVHEADREHGDAQDLQAGGGVLGVGDGRTSPPQGRGAGHPARCAAAQRGPGSGRTRAAAIGAPSGAPAARRRQAPPAPRVSLPGCGVTFPIAQRRERATIKRRERCGRAPLRQRALPPFTRPLTDANVDPPE